MTTVMSLVRRPGRRTACVVAVCCAALAGCGGGPEVEAASRPQAAPPVSGTAAPPAPSGVVRPAPSGASSVSGTSVRGPAAPSPSASPARVSKPAPSPSRATPAPVQPASGAPRASAIPKGAVVVGSGRAASCTGAAVRAAVAKVVRKGSGTVSFDCGKDPVTIAIDRPLSFTGTASSRFVLDGRGLVTLDGRGRTGLVQLSETAGLSATFRGLTFTRARTAVRGAAIHGGWRNRLLVEDCTFTSNAVTRSSDGEAGGGAIYVHEGSATVRRSTFRGNSALLGGALQNVIGDVVVESSTFTGNRATSFGGGIYSDSGSLVVRASTVSGNRGVHQGGGLFVWNAKNKVSRIERSTITGNRVTRGDSSGGLGAGVRNGVGPLRITDSTISRNISDSQGGGLWNGEDAVVTIVRTRFVGNKAIMGGAIMKVSGTVTTTACTFRGNTPGDVR